MQPKEVFEKGRTLEDRLADKFDQLQQAREMADGDGFDETCHSMEILFKGIPQAYEVLMEEKQEMDADLEKIFAEIEAKANTLIQDPTRQAYMNHEKAMANWEYRETYEELLIDIMREFSLIPMRYTTYADMQSTSDEEPIELNPEEEKEEPEPPVEEPKDKKPHLSIKKDEGFNV